MQEPSTEELRRLNRALQTLSDCNQALVRAPDEATLLADVCRLLVERGGYRMAWVGYAERDETKSVRPVARAGFETDYLDRARITWADTENGRGPTGVAIRTGRPVIAQNILTDPALGPWRAAAAQHGYASSAALPLQHGDDVFGALMAYAAAPDAFQPDEMKLLSELAGDLAYGIVGQRERLEHGRAEAALRASEREYRELVMLANSIILRWSRDGRITFLNEFGCRFFGYTEAEVVGRHVLGTVVPENESTGRDLRPLMDEICANPERFERNINENVRSNGERVWIDWTNKVVLDAQGQIVEIMSIGSDITDRRRADEEIRRLNEDLQRHAEALEQRVAERTAELTERNAALRESERRYRLLADNSEDVIWTMDLDLRFTYISPSVTRLRGYTAPEAMAQSIAESVTPDSWARIQAVLAEELEIERAPEKRAYHSRMLEVEYKRQGGGTVWTEVNAAFLRDDDNRACGIIGATRNITERQRLDREIRSAKDAAEQANRAKSAFLASMSHELRTPLQGILGFAEILARGMAGVLTGQQRQYAENIVTSGEHLLRLINDILDLAKVEARKMTLEQAPVAIDELLSVSLALFRERAAAKRLTLSIALSDDLRGRQIWADERKVRQILWNLLSNAVKFTPPGGAVELRASKVDDRIVFAVADTGIGISPADQQRVFNAFEQVRKEGQPAPPGTGLGLALCRQLAELHGGSIWVESRGEGCGSAFFFSLPARMEDSAETSPVGPARRDRAKLSGRVLVVDDDEISILMIHDLLKLNGAEALPARSAEEALRLAKTEHPDAIVMDIGLPHLDGLAATRRLKADPETAHIPIVVLTAYAMPTDAEKAREAGCDFFLAKPVDVREFLDVVARVLGAAPGRGV